MNHPGVFLSSGQIVNKVNPVLQSLTVLFNIGSTDSAYSDVIYSIYIYGHTRTHTRTHTVYYNRLCDASSASVYNMCTKFVIMKRFNFLFFSDSCLCVSDRIPKVSRKDNACSSFSFFFFLL